jgi:hypothetical protein
MISEGRDRVSLATGQPLEHFLHWKQTLMSTPEISSTACFKPCPFFLFLMVITVVTFRDAGKSVRMWATDLRALRRFWTAVAACRGEAQRRLERSDDTAFRP